MELKLLECFDYLLCIKFIKMNTLEKIVSWLALVVSLTTLCLHIFKVLPFSVIDSNTFISAVVALIGVMVALLVGYQIYEAVEIRGKLKEIEKLQQQVELTSQEVKQERNKMEEHSCWMLYQIFDGQEHRGVDAFLWLHQSLVYSLSTETIKGEMNTNFDDLIKAMCRINYAAIAESFHGSFEERMESLKYHYKGQAAYIKSNENYYIIKEYYEDIMARFEKRLENIMEGKTVSPDAIDGVIKDISEI